MTGPLAGCGTLVLRGCTTHLHVQLGVDLDGKLDLWKGTECTQQGQMHVCMYAATTVFRMQQQRLTLTWCTAICTGQASAHVCQQCYLDTPQAHFLCWCWCCRRHRCHCRCRRYRRCQCQSPSQSRTVEVWGEDGEGGAGTKQCRRCCRCVRCHCRRVMRSTHCLEAGCGCAARERTSLQHHLLLQAASHLQQGA